jgi:predicted nuclease with RNAse H fold
VVGLGIDVQVSRNCPFTAIDESGGFLDGGWICRPEDLAVVVTRLQDYGAVVVGIDAPRVPRAVPRALAFRSGAWRANGGLGWGRHCEVVIKSLGLGNPQWTPLAPDAPEWMKLGFSLFEAASQAEEVFEVFPTATYRALSDLEVPVTAPVHLGLAASGPKDMLDAAAAAVTALRVARGEGCEVGGGDGLGTIALPRPLTKPELANPVHRWPG